MDKKNSLNQNNSESISVQETSNVEFSSYDELSLEEQRIQLEMELLELEREKLEDIQRQKELEDLADVEITGKHLIMVAVLCLLFSGIVSYLCGFEFGKKYAPPPQFVELDKTFIAAVTPSALPKDDTEPQWMIKNAQPPTSLIHIR